MSLLFPSRYRNLTGVGLVLTPVVLLCIYFVDLPVALFVKDRLYSNTGWAKATSDMPDLLLMVVLLSMLLSGAVFLVRTRKGLHDATTDLSKLLFWVAPSSYLLKMLLKMIFGRVNTRAWLQEPGLYGFNWFQMREGCEGFPSGHMLVIVTLLAAAWRLYPVSRPLCLCTGILLGAALVVTNYHFVSDIIAGAYLGVLVEAVAFRLLTAGPSQASIDRG